jgi:hypothetical protein
MGQRQKKAQGYRSPFHLVAVGVRMPRSQYPGPASLSARERTAYTSKGCRIRHNASPFEEPLRKDVKGKRDGLQCAILPRLQNSLDRV